LERQYGHILAGFITQGQRTRDVVGGSAFIAGVPV
jgi:hypothetical protein